ncbi:alpha-galactosidase A [Podarcis lilfordi]|uniref:Alpha-galactosidase A n=1 Tax=Podarcis lilfordi TaxID=74358 RepID=A0AA35LNZ4_9SAUR|nr:alpha-galactosidase A [Podarcis lilfordi]
MTHDAPAVGHFGRYRTTHLESNFELWERPLSGRAFTISVLNRQEIGGPQAFVFSTAFLGNGLACNPACSIQQILPTSVDLGLHNWVSPLKVVVNPTGTVLLKMVVTEEKLFDNGNKHFPEFL